MYPAKNSLMEEDLVHLHQHNRFHPTFLNNPEIDIIILQPQILQQSTDAHREILHLKSSLRGLRYTDATGPTKLNELSSKLSPMDAIAFKNNFMR